MGKDNITFHSQIWPAELLAYSGKGAKGGTPRQYGELNLPTEVVSSEFLTMEGRKFSSSKRVVIYVRDLLSRYQPDAFRYFVAAAGPESQDSDFTWSEFVRRTNDELVAGWGNLVNRTANLIAKNFGEIPKAGELTAEDQALLAGTEAAFGTVGDLIDRHRQKQAIGEAMRAVAEVNKYVSDTEPWKIKDDPERLGTVLHVVAQCVADLNLVLSPFLPFAANEVDLALGGAGDVAPMPRIEEVEDLDGGAPYPIITGDYSGFPAWERRPIVPGTPVAKPTPIFTKLDPSVVDEELARLGRLSRGDGGGSQSPLTRPRSAFVSPRAFLASSRRRWEPRVGFVGRRGGGGGASAVRSCSASRSRAAARLRCWERCSVATTRSTGPGRRRSRRARCSSSSAAEAATSYSSSTRLSVVLTDCPPGPGERLNRSTSSASGISSPSGSPGPGGTRTVSPAWRHSMAGHVSITIGTPAATVRWNASSSTTPSWNHTPRAPIATAWSANSPAASERRNTSTTSTGNGIVGQAGVPLLAEHGRRGRVHRDDPLAATLEQLRDGVRRAGRVAREADDGPGLAVVEHEPHPFRILPVRHGPEPRREIPTQ